MSDGPHRSLPLRRAWKKVCEIADGRAHAIEEVIERIPVALAADVKGEIASSLFRALRRILCPIQPSLVDDAQLQIAALRPGACSVMEIDLIECVGDALRRGKSGADALQSGAETVLAERAQAAKRAVVEHYLRRAPQARAAHVDQRISSAIQNGAAEVREMAAAFVYGVARSTPLPAIDQSGLDDGPAIP